MQLKQFIPQEFCLKCDVCCRFYQDHCVWAPLFTESEISCLVKKSILSSLIFTTSATANTGGQRINLLKHQDYFVCPCFNPSDSKCKIYIYRPFECQLYPFLLTREGTQFYLAQDKKCPYLNITGEHKIKAYAGYLKNEFKKKDTISFLRQNQELFAEYPTADLKLLFPIEL